MKMSSREMMVVDKCGPDEVLLRQDALVALYYGVRNSQQRKRWETSTIDQIDDKGKFRLVVNRAFKRRSRPSRSGRIDTVLLRVDDGENLQSDDVCTAVELLCELYQCPVARFNDRPPWGGDRHVFFDKTPWQDIFPQLEAIWSKNDRVVVYYAWGLAESFHQWAAAFQPELVDRLDDCAGKIIVVVPSIRRITPELLATLKSGRYRIWGA